MSLYTLLLVVFHCTCVPAAVAAPAHDYHVSKTNVRYVAGARQVQVEMHVFVDDLEEALRDAGAPRLDLGSDTEAADSKRYLTAYLEKHFKLTLNGEALTTYLVGYELEDDMHGLWIYLAADEVAAPESMGVENSVLTEFFADQQNIVKLFDGEERVTTLLMSRNRRGGEASFSKE